MEEHEMMDDVRSLAKQLAGDDKKLEHQLIYCGCEGIAGQLELDTIEERMTALKAKLKPEKKHE